MEYVLKPTAFLMRLISCVALALGLIVLPLHAAPKVDGMSVPTLSAASALNTPLGVRSYGMGMAQTGNANDLSALYYNPAALADMNYVEYALSYHSSANDVSGNSFLMSIPLPYGNMGLSGAFNYVQNNEYVQNGVNIVPDRNKYSYIAGLSYGAPILPRLLTGGMTVKWFGANFLASPAVTSYEQQQKGLFIDLALRSLFDPGLYYEWLHWLPRFSAGVAARNLHPLMKIPNEVTSGQNREEYNAGFSMHFPYKFMLNLDLVNSLNLPTMYRLGFEYWPVHFLALRGGMTSSNSGSRFQSVHWGIGIGETIQNSKLSFEYSGAKEYLGGFGANFERVNETYHRFAFHQSFESIEVDSKGRVRPIRYTERYTHRYRFASELAPREIIADSVTSLNAEEASYNAALNAVGNQTALDVQEPTEEPAVPPGKKPLKTPAQILQQQQHIVGKHIVAVYPVSVELIAGSQKNFSLKEKIRGSYLVEVNRGGAGRLINSAKLTAAPSQGEKELESAYLKRLQKSLGADLIVFTKLYVDGNTGELRLVTLYYLKNDNQISAQTTVKGSDAREAEFMQKVTAKFVSDHKALLGELK